MGIFYDNFSDMLEDTYNFIQQKLEKKPFALYGHSMGSLLAFELYYVIKQRLQVEPLHIFLSCCPPPHKLASRKKIHTLPDKKFIEEILLYKGIPRDLVEDQELLNIFLPIFKADIKVFESYGLAIKKQKINNDVTVLYGKNDSSINKYDIAQWQVYTGSNCFLYEFDGGHFLNIERSTEVISLINSTLNKYLNNIGTR